MKGGGGGRNRVYVEGPDNETKRKKERCKNRPESRLKSLISSQAVCMRKASSLRVKLKERAYCFAQVSRNG
jgi:hypothetical protein